VPQYRLTGMFELEGTQPAGFSESWDFIATDDPGALLMPSSWAKERVRILSEDWTLTALRLSRLSAVGDPGECGLFQQIVEANVCRPPDPGTLGPADSPYSAVYITINTRQSTPSSGKPPRPRRWLLRGIPDSWWDAGQLQRDGPVVASVNRYMNWLITNMQAGQTALAFACDQVHLLPYSSYCIRRIASRRVGRPFDLLRGRRSNRVVTPPPVA